MSDIISRDTVREHLVELGYAPNSLPDTVLDNFVKELETLYQNGHFDEEPTFQSDHNEENQAQFISKNSKIVYSSENQNSKIVKNLHHSKEQILSKQPENFELDEFMEESVRDNSRYCASHNESFIPSVPDYEKQFEAYEKEVGDNLQQIQLLSEEISENMYIKDESQNQEGESLIDRIANLDLDLGALQNTVREQMSSMYTPPMVFNTLYF